MWYFEWADLVPGQPYPKSTSKWNYESMVEQEIWNYNLAKANATASQSGQ
jgi:hypothetical protein